MNTPPVKFSSVLQIYSGDASWHYIIVPQIESAALKELFIWPPRGFGSIPVQVSIGRSVWKTSVFPQKGGTFFLPVKKQIRLDENLKVGELIDVTLIVRN